MSRGSQDRDDLKNKLLVGAGCAILIIAWMVFGGPREEGLSQGGFNLASEVAVPRRGAALPSPPRTPQTSFDMVRPAFGDGPSGVIPEGQADVEAAAPPAAPGPAPTPAGPAPTAPVDASVGSAAAEAKDLASAGIPTDDKGLSRLGAKEGLLSALAGKMLDHPSVLKAIFNNKMVVDAFMSRDISKRNCESGDALKSYLSDPNSGGMAKVFPVIQQALSRPAAAAALAGTEMAKRVMDCPSISALTKDPGAVMSIAMSNSKALGVLTDPRMATALASNPRASGMLAGVQSSMGGQK